MFSHWARPRLGARIGAFRQRRPLDRGAGCAGTGAELANPHVQDSAPLLGAPPTLVVVADGAQGFSQRLLSLRYRRGQGPALELSAAQRQLVRELHERLRSGAYALVPGPCICAEVRGTLIARVDRYGLPLDTVMCEACGTLRTDPYLDGPCLDDFYQRLYQVLYGRAAEPAAYFRRQRGYGKRLLSWAAPRLPAGAAVAEIGCGAGGALAVFQEAGFQVSGCDYSRELVEHGRCAGVSGLQVGGLDAFARSQSSAAFDLLYLHHVFEHLADPVAALQQAILLTKPEGVVVIAVPDVSRSSEFRAKRDNMRLYLHLAHKYNYTLAGLDRLAARVALDASILDVAHDDTGPEFWVGFSRALVGQPASEAASAGHPVELFEKLRRNELRFMRRHALKLIRGQIRHSLGSWLEG